MLSHEDNAVVSQVGPGTPMGELMRQYWVPALLSEELPVNDGDPVRVMLLGERLVAFRDSRGEVGLLRNLCPHRGASLFYGRNEECGLRCVYHGWKFSTDGECVDMPNEPATSNFKSRIRARSYPCVERGGVVWAYLGSRATPPPLPDIEANQLPEGSYEVSAVQRECNWLQSLEGDVDTSHFSFLHTGSVEVEDTRPGTFGYYQARDRAPRYAVVDMPYGAMYGAYRPAESGENYWRIAQFLFPFYTHIPTGVLGHKILTRAWVPMDDHHTMFFNFAHVDRSRTAPGRPARENVVVSNLLPNTTGWFGRFRLEADEENDYLIDRDWQRDGSFTGIEGIHTQDQAVTESMGEIFDRSEEHLGTSDVMIARVRQRVLQAAQALADKQVVPPGVDEPEVYRTRSGGVILPEGADWVAETEELRQAYVEHPELNLEIDAR